MTDIIVAEPGAAWSPPCTGDGLAGTRPREEKDGARYYDAELGRFIQADSVL